MKLLLSLYFFNFYLIVSSCLCTATTQESGAAPLCIIIEVPVADLIDKITILQLKNNYINDPIQLANVQAELATLMEIYTQHIHETATLKELMRMLYDVNHIMWETEDAIRAKELHQQFDEEFIELARRVYFSNDQRARIKRTINQLCCSRLIEEKHHTKYHLP